MKKVYQDAFFNEKQFFALQQTELNNSNSLYLEKVLFESVMDIAKINDIGSEKLLVLTHIVLSGFRLYNSLPLKTVADLESLKMLMRGYILAVNNEIEKGVFNEDL